MYGAINSDGFVMEDLNGPLTHQEESVEDMDGQDETIDSSYIRGRIVSELTLPEVCNILNLSNQMDVQRILDCYYDSKSKGAFVEKVSKYLAYSTHLAEKTWDRLSEFKGELNALKSGQKITLAIKGKDWGQGMFIGQVDNKLKFRMESRHIITLPHASVFKSSDINVGILSDEDTTPSEKDPSTNLVNLENTEIYKRGVVKSSTVGRGDIANELENEFASVQNQFAEVKKLLDDAGRYVVRDTSSGLGLSYVVTFNPDFVHRGFLNEATEMWQQFGPNYTVQEGDGTITFTYRASSRVTRPAPAGEGNVPAPSTETPTPSATPEAEPMSIGEVTESIHSAVAVIVSDPTGNEPTLSYFADLVNAVQNDYHFVHFLASGQDGHWDRIHEICSDYYSRLADQYDDIAELALQVGENISNPNVSATAIGFTPQQMGLPGGFDYNSAMSIVYQELTEILAYATALNKRYSQFEDDPNAVGICNYLQGFIEGWSKDANYKTLRRLAGSAISSPNPVAPPIDGDTESQGMVVVEEGITSAVPGAARGANIFKRMGDAIGKKFDDTFGGQNIAEGDTVRLKKQVFFQIPANVTGKLIKQTSTKEAIVQFDSGDLPDPEWTSPVAVRYKDLQVFEDNEVQTKRKIDLNFKPGLKGTVVGLVDGKTVKIQFEGGPVTDSVMVPAKYLTVVGHAKKQQAPAKAPATRTRRSPSRRKTQASLRHIGEGRFQLMGDAPQEFDSLLSALEALVPNYRLTLIDEGIEVLLTDQRLLMSGALSDFMKNNDNANDELDDDDKNVLKLLAKGAQAESGLARQYGDFWLVTSYTDTMDEDGNCVDDVDEENPEKRWSSLSIPKGSLSGKIASVAKQINSDKEAATIALFNHLVYSVYEAANGKTYPDAVGAGKNAQAAWDESVQWFTDKYGHEPNKGPNWMFVMRHFKELKGDGFKEADDIVTDAMDEIEYGRRGRRVPTPKKDRTPYKGVRRGDIKASRSADTPDYFGADDGSGYTDINQLIDDLIGGKLDEYEAARNLAYGPIGMDWDEAVKLVDEVIQGGDILSVKRRIHSALGHTTLGAAVRAGDPMEVKDLIKKAQAEGREWSIDESTGTPLLHFAIDDQNRQMIKLLYDMGVPVDETDSMGNTSLMVAASNGDIETMKLLLDEGADVNAEDHFGETALDKAQLYDSEIDERTGSKAYKTFRFLNKGGYGAEHGSSWVEHGRYLAPDDQKNVDAWTRDYLIDEEGNEKDFPLAADDEEDYDAGE